MANKTDIKPVDCEAPCDPPGISDVLDALPEVFGVFDANNRLVDCNLAFEKFTRKKKADLVGKTYREIAALPAKYLVTMDGEKTPKDPRKFAEIAEKLSQQPGHTFEAEAFDGTIWQMNHRRVRKGGQVFFARNITSEKMAQRQLEKAVNSIPDCMTIRDKNGHYIACNASFANFLGLSREEVLGKTPGEVYGHSLDKWKKIEGVPFKGNAEQLVAIIEEAYRTQGSMNYETTDGEFFQAVYRTVPGIGSVSISRNLTELRRAEIKLEQAIEAIPDFMTITDENGYYIACNSAFANWLGQPKEKIIGKSRQEIVNLTTKRWKSINGKPFDGNTEELIKQFQEAAKTHKYLEYETTDGGIHHAVFRQIPGVGGVALSRDMTGQRLAERKLKEAFEAIPDLISMTGPDGRVIAVNTAFSEYLGLPKEKIEGQLRKDIIGRSVKKIKKINGKSVKLTLPEYLKIFNKAAKDQENLEIETTDGRIRQAIYRQIPGGGVISIARDVTAIREAQQELSEAIEAVPDLITITNGEGTVVACNSETLAFLGMSREKVVGQPREKIVASAARKFKKLNGEELKASGKELVDIFNKATSENATLEFETEGGIIRQSVYREIPGGGVISIARDITDIRRAELELMENERKLRILVESIPLPLVVTRVEDSTILFASPAAKKALRAKTLLGRKTNEFYGEPEIQQLKHDDLQKTGGLYNYEGLVKRDDGTTFPALVSVEIFHFEGVTASVICLADITEQKELEQKFSEQREALYQSEKMSALGTLLAGVAHELNNPLSVVVGQALLLQETTRDQIAKKRAEKIGSAADRCAKIVKTFLAMARQKPPEEQNVDLNEVIESALDVTSFALRQNQIEIEMALQDEIPKIWGDGDQLGQVIMNLILNAQHALEAQNKERQIFIKSWWQPDANEVCFSVKDNGPGIPEEIQGRIFEPFYTTKDVGEGTGLGLSLAQSVVKSHNGLISIKSSPGKGTEFLIRLPQTDHRCAPEATEAEQGKAAPNLHVLVIDDEPEVLDMMEEILEMQGHDVAKAETGKAALDLLGSNSFDAIISDIRMPELDGPGLFEAIKKSHPELAARIGFITGDSLSKQASDFLKKSKRPSVEKPFGPGEITKLLKQLTK